MLFNCWHLRKHSCKPVACAMLGVDVMPQRIAQRLCVLSTRRKVQRVLVYSCHVDMLAVELTSIQLNMPGLVSDLLAGIV